MAFGGHKTLTHLTLQGNDQNDMLPPLCEVLRNPKCNLKYLRYISLTTAENPQPVNRASTNLDGNAVQIRGGRNPLFWLDTPRQYSCLENPMDGGAWWATVHGVAKSQTRLSDFTFTFHFHALEKAMATHSSVLAWRIPGMGKSGGLPSMGSHRVGHDCSNLAAVAAAA